MAKVIESVGLVGLFKALSPTAKSKAQQRFFGKNKHRGTVGLKNIHPPIGDIYIHNSI